MSLIQADARRIPLVDGCVQCVVTSPPYWGLRDYGVEGQIGLEASPEAYTAGLVAVFREVWRVLADDGVLWLNLGDSYAGGGGFAPDAPVNVARREKLANGERTDGVFNLSQRQHERNIKGGKVPAGLKPKDLVGIPWRVAFALQQPWYAGSINDERDRIWLAAMIDAEGSICIERQKPVDGGRVRDCFAATVRVHNTSRAIVDRCAEIAGVGSIRMHDTRRQPVSVWCAYGQNARDILREVYPYLVAKKHQARLALGQRNMAGYEAMKLLHAGSVVSVDAPEPESLLAPGWYLRSDIIWSKPNPMPESVTDRPTKAHEYVFLLTKQERYYYDAKAIATPAVTAGGIGGFTGYQATAMNRPPSGNQIREKGVSYVRPETTNCRSVWTINPKPYAGAHFATMPEKLAERCILAGSRPGDLILDPFGGSGTTVRVARRFNRRGVMLDLNPAYLQLAGQRISGVQTDLFEVPA